MSEDSDKQNGLAVLDDLDVLRIEIEAVSVCCNRGDFDPLRAPGEQMVDNDYRAAVRDYFSDCPEWEDWMVEPLLSEVKRAVALRDQLDCFCNDLLRSFA